MNIGDISPLTEVAPAHPEALQVLSFAWLHAQNASQDPPTLRNKIDTTIQQLVASFRGTDGVTLLEFLGSFLHHADPEVYIHLLCLEIPCYLHRTIGNTARSKMAGGRNFLHSPSRHEPPNP